MNNEYSFKASCHCGAVQIEFQSKSGELEQYGCSCSICTIRNSKMTPVPLALLQVKSGLNNLTLYQFHTMTAKHYFCKTCGIYTHHQRRSRPDQYAVNVACIHGVGK
ncbi:GFA family protein [Vibrio penaeicida]|uniref:GFA family protein n=1 Tax=Vibrio penaeicida TaxID=104609 RepID=UPI000F81BC19|nr:GFA family protein [Vibrio penaeicida]RTZ21508.1 GFA family protein [Vibrio penaeicida]